MLVGIRGGVQGDWSLEGGSQVDCFNHPVGGQCPQPFETKQETGYCGSMRAGSRDKKKEERGERSIKFVVKNEKSRKETEEEDLKMMLQKDIRREGGNSRTVT